MFRLTIRDLLWLTTVVALGAAWWVDGSRLDVLFREQATEVRTQREDAKAFLRLAQEMEAKLAETETELRAAYAEVGWKRAEPWIHRPRSAQKTGSPPNPAEK